MTTDVHERITMPPVTPARPRGARAWLTFLLTVVLAAVVIGVVAALLGNAARGLDAAVAAESQAQAAVDVAGDQADAAQVALEAGQAEIDDRRRAILDALAAQPQPSGFSGSPSSGAFAEVDAMADSLAAHEAPAVVAAKVAQERAQRTLDAAGEQVAAAQREVARLVPPMWITASAGVLLIGLVLWAAIVRTRSVRRR